MPEASDADVVLNELAEEFAARHRAGERPRVEEYCDRHPALAADIRSLFPALVELERAKADVGPELAVADAAPAVTHIGDFRLLREVGRGGMGVVYEAEQVSLGRRVALKLLPAAVLRDPGRRRRFEREAKAAARLHHTNIVPVHGFGEHDGTPYYVMQFIPGLGLDAVIDELARSPTSGRPPGPSRALSAERARLSAVLARSGLGAGAPGAIGAAGYDPLATVVGKPPPDPAPPVPTRGDSTSPSRSERGAAVSLSTSDIHLPGLPASGGSGSGKKATYWMSVARIGVQVAGALAYAHKLGVMHRDIKPANLLLDLEGTVWVTDFGLAKANDSDDLTHTGDLLGTLRYMPPEAFEGKADARGDIYALGLTLFELVALRPAYSDHDRNKLIRQVTMGDSPPLRKLCRDAPRDLVTIIEKATDKNPARRYQSAAALADDLQRFLDGRPITARRATELERLWMWARRRPTMAGLVAALFLCLLAGSIVSTVFAVRANGFARDAELREQDATAARDAARRNADEAKEARNTAALQAAGLLLDRGIEDARGGEPARALHLFVRALRALPADDSRSAPLERVIRANLSAWAQTVPALEHIWPGGFRSTTLAYSPDSKWFAAAIGTDEIRCFQTDTGLPVGPTLRIPVWSRAAMEFAADGRSLWVASSSAADALDHWALHRVDPVTGRSIQSAIPSPGPVNRLLVTPNGRYLVGSIWELHPDDRGASGADRVRRWRTAALVVWEAASGRVVRRVDVKAQSDLATANAQPDTYLALAPDGGSVTAWIQRGNNRFEGLTFTVGGDEHPVRTELPEVGPAARWGLHFQHRMQSAIVLKGGQLHRWSATNPSALGPGVPTPFRSVLDAPAPDGRSLISPTDGRIHDTGAWPPRPSSARFNHPAWPRNWNASAEYSPDGRLLATWSPFSGIDARLWRLPRPHSRPPLPPTRLDEQTEQASSYPDAQFGGDSARVALWLPRWRRAERADDLGDVRIVDVATGAVRVTSLPHSKLVRDVVIAPNGHHFATGSFDGTARVWDMSTGRPAGPPLGHTNYVATVAFSPDGNTLAAGDFGPAGLIKLWDWRTGTEVRPALPHDDIVLSVAFSPDGRYLAALKAIDWSHNPEFLVWEVASGTIAFRVPHAGQDTVRPRVPQFRPDNRAVLTRDVKGVLRLWAFPTGAPLGERQFDGTGVARFAPDGRVIAAVGNLGVRLLDGNTLDPLPAGYLPHPDPILDVAFSPDGTLLLTSHETGSAQLWDVATCKPIGPPAVLLGPICAVAFTPDGRTCLCVTHDGTVRRWPVPTPLAEPDLDRLADRVTLMTGQKMDEYQGLDSVPAEQWNALRAQLVGEGSTALVPPRPDMDWHDTVAADAEQDGDAFGAAWHLERLAVLRPNDWTVPARLGRVLAATGHKVEAAAAYDRAARLSASARDLADWLRAAAEAASSNGQYDLGLWNLDRAVKLTPDDWVPYAARGALADRAGQVERAAADVDAAIRLGAESTAVVQAVERLVSRATKPADWTRAAALLTTAARDPKLPIDDRYHLAVARLKAGDHAGYRAACSELAGRLPPPAAPVFIGDVLAAVRAFTLGAGATDDWSGPLGRVDRILARLAEREAADPSQKEALKPIRQLFLQARGALLYRAGRVEEAIKALRESTSLHPDGGEFRDWLFLALAEQRLGHAGAAKEAATKTRSARQKARPDTIWDKAEIEMLAAELDAVAPIGK